MAMGGGGVCRKVGDCTGVAMATSEGKCHGKYHSLRGGISRCHFKGKKSKKKKENKNKIR